MTKNTLSEKHYQHQDYEIRIKGHLDPRWAEWFDSLAITLDENGCMLLTGPVVDQAALYGLLKKVRDLGLTWSRSILSKTTRQISQTSNNKWIYATWKGVLPLITFPAHFSPRGIGC